MEEAKAQNKAWQMPWNKVPVKIPENPLSGIKYRGMNRLSLTIEASGRGIPNKWVTFKQAAKAGLKIKKGEHGVALEKWGLRDLKQTADETNIKLFQAENPNNAEKANNAVFIDEKRDKYSFENAAKKSVPYVKTFTVFNVTQIENAPKEWQENPLKDLTEPEKIKKAEALISAMEQDGVKVEYGGNKASYHPLNDTVNMPDRRQFTSPENLYGTLLHEISHSTGHTKRLNREFGYYGDEKYSKEELRAEIASYFLASETGINFDTGNTAVYLNSWIKALKDNKNELFKAAKDASNAVDYINERVNKLDIDGIKETQPDAFAQDLQNRLNKSKKFGIGG